MHSNFDQMKTNVAKINNLFSDKSSGLALTETTAGANHSSLIVRQGDYVVEIAEDRENQRTKFYDVAQQRGSNDIIGWGAAQSFDDAVREGESLIYGLATRRRTSIFTSTT